MSLGSMVHTLNGGIRAILTTLDSTDRLECRVVSSDSTERLECRVVSIDSDLGIRPIAELIEVPIVGPERQSCSNAHSHDKPSTSSD